MQERQLSALTELRQADVPPQERLEQEKVEPGPEQYRPAEL